MAEILVVDDNPTNLRLLELILRVAGHHVLLAADADATEKILADHVPALILMDLQLPGVDGLTLTRRVKADPRLAHIPVIAVTSYAMRGDEERARAAGCDDYVTKPVDTRTLPLLVERHLKK